MKHLLASIIVILFLVGCVGTGPDVPNYKINQTDNVGYIIKINTHMAHTHIGTTIFSNFEKDYPKLVKKDDIEKLLKQNIHANLVDLSSYKFEDIDKLIIENNNEWVVNNQILYNELIDKHKLKAIIVVSEGAAGIYIYPTYHSLKSSGILSRSFLNLDTYLAISGFSFKLNILNPKAVKDMNREMVKADYIYSTINTTIQKKSGFIKPHDNENITIEEQNSIKKSILEITHNNIKQINKHLSNIK